MTALKIRKANKLLRSSIVLLERKGRSERGPPSGETRQVPRLGASHLAGGQRGHLSHVGDVSAVFVPGKVLGTGDLDKKLDVGAFSFSAAARSKIEPAGGKALTVEEFVRQYPQGSGVALVK